jgi:hypothetical protein
MNMYLLVSAAIFITPIGAFKTQIWETWYDPTSLLSLRMVVL